MHMADALLAPAVAATMYVASGVTAGVSVHKLRRDDEEQKLPVMAVSMRTAIRRMIAVACLTTHLGSESNFS